MKNFTDANLANAALKPKVISLGFTNVHVNAPSLEAANVDALIKQCKRKNSPQLVNPLSAVDFYKSAALIEVCREQNKCFEIPLSYILKSDNQSLMFFQLRIFLKNCLRRRVPFCFSTRAHNEFELRSPRELIAIGQTLGLTYEQAAAGLRSKLE